MYMNDVCVGCVLYVCVCVVSVFVISLRIDRIADRGAKFSAQPSHNNWTRDRVFDYNLTRDRVFESYLGI